MHASSYHNFRNLTVAYEGPWKPLGLIRIGFNADPAFYLNAVPDPGSQTNADPDPVRTYKLYLRTVNIATNLIFRGKIYLDVK
jgi:hypothetical protein